ncbi:MAG TPA: shikimate dehydrogenase [Bacteroidota bacterium]|nr:shikimate dehydrogenase [Bacteroidota bacterium]
MKQSLLGIIGHHISYTLSPALHNEAIRVLGLPYTYGVFDVSGEMLPGLLEAMRREHVRGANVTKPHKEAVMPLLDELSGEATALGAVNTIVNTDGVLRGENTDVDGVRASLVPHAAMLSNEPLLVLGAGGASRAALYAAAEFRPCTIMIHNRNTERARQTAAIFAALFPDVRFDVVEAANLVQAASQARLIVNTTTVGMTPDTDAMPLPNETRFSNHQIIFDIVYTPLQTALLRKAAADGAAVINGMDMFIHQGARAFTLWTGEKFPVQAPRERVLRELGMR